MRRDCAGTQALQWPRGSARGFLRRPGSRREIIQSASSRTKNVMGATLVGTTRRRSGPAESRRSRVRRQAAPADRAGEAKAGRAPSDRSPRCGAPESAAPRHWPGPHTLASAAGSRACRARPALACQGATCCQRSSQRMNCAGLTGSICLRSVPTVRRWMRASRRRSHHSVLALARIGSSSCSGEPSPSASTEPLASRRSKRLVDFGGLDAQDMCQLACGDRAAVRDPSGHQLRRWRPRATRTPSPTSGSA